MIVERQTIPHLNALVGDSKIIREQLSCSIRGCHATTSLKSVFFRRNVAWSSLIELHGCSLEILEPTFRGLKWGIICLSSTSGSLSNPLFTKYSNPLVRYFRSVVYKEWTFTTLYFYISGRNKYTLWWFCVKNVQILGMHPSKVWAVRGPQKFKSVHKIYWGSKCLIHPPFSFYWSCRDKWYISPLNALFCGYYKLPFHRYNSHTSWAPPISLKKHIFSWWRARLNLHGSHCLSKNYYMKKIRGLSW